MIQRKEVVFSVLGELQEATESSGLDSLTRVALEVDQVLIPFLLPEAPCQDFPEWAGVDYTSQGLYPADAPMGLLPLNCKGEGNLLFDAVSMLLVGHTGLSLELQVRTVLEMVLWKRYYLSGMIDSKVMLQAVRFGLCAEESEYMLNLPASVLEAIFDADVKASCFPGSYANMWHVYALSSVLQFKIYSIYPMFNLKIRPYFNRLIRPRIWPKNFLTVRRVSPTKSEELLNQDLQLSYPGLKDKYNITKRTFYRWKRQTQEHCKKSAARSSYYNWKHELLKSGGNFSTTSSNGEISPGESTEQDAWSSPEVKHDELDHQDSLASMFGLGLSKLDVERAQNVAHMQEAKRCLQNCIAMNASLPFRIFKSNFPGISRSTYYNWRREALMFNRGYKGSTGSSEESSDADKSPKSLLQVLPNLNQAFVPRMRISRRKHRSFRLAYMSKKQLRDAAKLHVQKSRCSLTKFKLKFPSMSPCFYWLWRNSQTGKKKIVMKNDKVDIPVIIENTVPEKQIMEIKIDQNVFPFVEGPKYLERNPIPSFHATHSQHIFHSKAPVDEQMFAMDVVALANFKAKAKLFLQQRFEEKSFPSFKEFRSYFPFTPRSTYYMWKRALHHGVSLVQG
ncbi:Vertnin [Dissostichus eleginoides]|uniref:Vertnin n=1 Tax=Dissostichus eleginoides TaxID=100907 RepID=A0AAD9BU73_DISEL|nr:Vertnin [Dissostichus eleginoides]